jgi:hypothetical protein
MKENHSLKGLITELLNASAGGTSNPALAEADAYFSALAKLDFGAALRQHFDRTQLREILAEIQRFLPALNRVVFAETRVPRLRNIARKLGAELDARPFGYGPQARRLRGFYVGPRGSGERAMICLNTATHRVGTAAAFWHEMGHHLTHRIFDETGDVSLSFGTNYQEHLQDPGEITADLVFVLGCYPKDAARRLFGTQQQRTPNVDRLISTATSYVRRVTGYDFEKDLSGGENLYRLAGMLYVAKLRAALWDGYNI